MYAKDRVDTTGSVFLGLTVGCATCHDHKFDPISQKDYYSLAAFFRNTTQNPLDGNIADTPPVLIVPAAADQDRWKAIPGDEAVLKGRALEARQGAASDFANWLDGKDRARIQTPLEPADELFALSLNPTNSQPRWTLRNKPLDAALPASIQAKDGALEFTAKDAVELPGLDWIEADKPFSIAARFRLPLGEDNYSIVSQTDPRSKGRGWALEINNRIPMFRLTGLAGRSIVLRGSIIKRLKPGEWYHLAVSYDGKRDLAGARLFLNGERAAGEGEGQSKLQGEIRTFVPLRVGGQGTRYLTGGAIADLRIFAGQLDEEQARLLADWPALERAKDKPAASLTDAERAAFDRYYFLREHSESIDLASQMRTLHEERITIQRRGSVTHVMQEKPEAPFAHVLHRGMYDQPRDKVTPSTPSVLPPMTSEYPRNRLGLAQWLVAPDHPLLARVTVNRFWQEIFGVGLVKSADDFGAQGEPPVNQELLDWLAVEFRESGWDVKKLVKLMVMSAAYRQSAQATPLKIEKDPENRLLSRGPRFRMDAEMVRDTALAASGLLVRKVGGPSVKPYQPEGIWETVAMQQSTTRFYRQDAGDKLYRRSMYTFLKRSAPPPAMDIFNATTREVCTVKRERTNTPLQALLTMNDVQFVEAARALAERAMKAAPGSFETQLDFMTARLIGRRLDAKERTIVQAAHKDFLRHYDGKPEDARKLIAQGESKPDPSLNAVELASVTMLANQLMNLDEVLNK
jgi:hypothetical protein